MTDVSSIPAGEPCWVELFTTDTEAAEGFYRPLFEWSFESGGEAFGGYLSVSMRGKRVAGCMHNDGSSGVPSVWAVYLATDDVDATTAAVRANGGQVVVEPMQVGDLGSMAVFTDPGGATIGAWQPATHTGFTVRDEPGAPAWFEVHTRDYDAVVPFYRDVFGWNVHTMSDTDDFRYSTMGEGEHARAGIMDASSMPVVGAPAYWTVYFEVADTDAFVSQVGALGGTVVMSPEDTPYGRLAVVADPTGAVFSVVRPPTG